MMLGTQEKHLSDHGLSTTQPWLFFVAEFALFHDPSTLLAANSLVNDSSGVASVTVLRELLHYHNGSRGLFENLCYSQVDIPAGIQGHFSHSWMALRFFP